MLKRLSRRLMATVLVVTLNGLAAPFSNAGLVLVDADKNVAYTQTSASGATSLVGYFADAYAELASATDFTAGTLTLPVGATTTSPVILSPETDPNGQPAREFELATTRVSQTSTRRSRWATTRSACPEAPRQHRTERRSTIPRTPILRFCPSSQRQRTPRLKVTTLRTRSRSTSTRSHRIRTPPKGTRSSASPRLPRGYLSLVKGFYRPRRRASLFPEHASTRNSSTTSH